MSDFLTKAIEGGGASGPLRRELKRLQAELAEVEKERDGLLEILADVKSEAKHYNELQELRAQLGKAVKWFQDNAYARDDIVVDEESMLELFDIIMEGKEDTLMCSEEDQ